VFGRCRFAVCCSEYDMHEHWVGDLPTWKRARWFCRAEILAMEKEIYPNSCVGRWSSCKEAHGTLDKQRRILVTFLHMGGRDKGADGARRRVELDGMHLTQYFRQHTIKGASSDTLAIAMACLFHSLCISHGVKDEIFVGEVAPHYCTSPLLFSTTSAIHYISEAISVRAPLKKMIA
jgi:hypothetical protein